MRKRGMNGARRGRCGRGSARGSRVGRKEPGSAAERWLRGASAVGGVAVVWSLRSSVFHGRGSRARPGAGDRQVEDGDVIGRRPPTRGPYRDDPPYPPPQAKGSRCILQGLAVALSLLAFPVVASSDRPPASPSALAAPAGLTVDASDRRLTVSWRPVAGATGYRVAARLTNGVEPFAWKEYDAASPPHAITDRWVVVSGLEYEVRVAAVHDDGPPMWSPSVAVTTPALRPAPPDAVELPVFPERMPRYVGDRMVVRLADSQRRATRRSRWIWSVCDPDGSSCALLPHPTRRSYLVGEAARGKQVRVRRDYDLGGSSWTATAVAGVVDREAPPLLRPPAPILPPGCGEMAPSGVPEAPDAFTKGADLTTHLHHLESRSVQIHGEESHGGAIEPLCEDLLVVTPQGRIALVRPDGSLAGLEGQVPMNRAGLRSSRKYASFLSHKPLTRAPRVTDIALKPRSEGRWELFVTHHHFTEECIRFRLSSTMVLRQGASVSVSPSWRTVFDFEPCVFRPTDLQRSGGRILTDGPERLLVVVGDHGRLERVQDPDSHLGKLVRIGIETGASEVLALGLRNPQGFARDADGRLWETEHGPRGGDELNVLEPGVNYGWPWVSYGIWYDGHDGGGSRLPSVPLEWTGGHDAFARPAFAWVPSVAVSALIVNDDRWFPLWKDDLIVGSLKDLSLFRVRRNGAGVQYVERIEVGYRVRDLAWMPDGRLALLADGGAVHFLSLASESGYCNDQYWPHPRPYPRPHLVIYALGCGLR